MAPFSVKLDQQIPEPNNDVAMGHPQLPEGVFWKEGMGDWTAKPSQSKVYDTFCYCFAWFFGNWNDHEGITIAVVI